MLYQPTNIYPSMTGSLGNGVIDAAKDLIVSWQVNGNSAMVGYQISIYKNDSASTQIYSTGKLTSGCPFYGVDYAGNVQFFSCTITAATLSSSGITNGGSYKLTIKQWWGSTDNQSVSQTSASAFITRSTPSISIAAIPSPLAVKEYSFAANYSQEQGDVLSWVKWKLALVSENGEYKTLKDTGNIYGTAQLKFDYDGFFSGSRYAVACNIQTQNGVEASTGWQGFSVSYDTTQLSGTLTATPNRKSNGIRLTFPTVTNIPATITGSYTMEDSYLNLPEGSNAAWDRVNGEAMDFEIPVNIAWRGKSNANGTILKATGTATSDIKVGQLPEKADWKSICYGNGKLVAVGNSTAAYSTDGIVWTSITIPQSTNWYSVCYGDGKFVAVGSDFASYSEDGITWAETSLQSTSVHRSVCYGNGKFVSIKWNSTSALYSTDGITWTETPMLQSKTSWESVCYGSGKFVAVGDGIAAYSTDGITWNESTIPTEPHWFTACYGSDRFVAIATNSSIAAYSTDGVTWYESTMPANVTWNSVCYGGSKFVAVANGAIAAYSEDGITWAEKNVKCGNWFCATYGTDCFAVVGTETDKSMLIYDESSEVDCHVTVTASDSFTVESTEMPININGSYWHSVCYGNGKFVAVTSGAIAAYSENGITWAETTMPKDSQWYSVCYGDGKFVAVGKSVAAYSADGITWTEATIPQSTTFWHSVCYGNGRFVAVALDSSTAAYSADGVTWYESTMPAYDAWNSVCYGNGKFVAVGRNGMGKSYAAYSTDGVTWYESTMPANVRWGFVCYGGGKYVAMAVSNEGAIAYSEDGATWIKNENEIFLNMQDLCYGAGMFFSTAYKRIVYSYDGITWISKENADATIISSVCFGAGKFISTVSNKAGTCIYPHKYITAEADYDFSANSLKEFYIDPSHSFALVITENGIDVNETTDSLNPGWDNLTSLEMSGEQYCDYLFVSEGTLSETEKNQILSDPNYHPNDVPALFFADFNGSTNGGGVGDTNISAFAIYRRSGEDEVLTHVIDTSAEDGNVLIDCGAVTGNQYTYYAYGIGTSTFESSALISSNVTPCFWDWVLLACSTDTNGVYHPQQIFLFSNNVSSGDVSNNNSPNVLQNFTRYPTIQPSPWNYRSGTLTSLIGSVSGGKYCDSVELRNAITELSTASRTLFLKNRKGDLIKIALSGAIEMETMDNSPQQAQTMKLPWVEIGDASGVSIVLTQNDGAWVQSLDSPVVMGCCGTGSGSATSYAYPLTILQQGKTTVYDGSEPKKVVIKDGGGSGEIVAEDDGSGNITIY